MAYTSLPTIAQDDVINVDYLGQIQANFDDHEGRLSAIGSAIIPNGSFETDSDSDGIPDNWTRTFHPGGSGGVYTVNPAEGASAIYFTRPVGESNGGGYEDSDYVPCSPTKMVLLSFVHWATAAAMRNRVQLWWFQKDKTASTTPSTTIYDSTANPTAQTRFSRGASPPADARFFKVRLEGGEPSVNVAGTAYFDMAELPSGVSETVVGYSQGTQITGASIAERIHIDGVLSSPTGEGNLYGTTGVRSFSVAGGGNILIDFRNSTVSLLTLSFSLADGNWTIFATGHNYDNNTNYLYLSLAAMAIRSK